jgi:SAM-dependent methyltransferase
VPTTEDSAAHWDGLHADPRFRPVYASEHVVRFLVRARAPFPKQSQLLFLDIGAGAGRHLRLAAEFGFVPFGVDISLAGLVHARERLCESPHFLALASMTDLPFANNSFHVALSYGSFYYGSAAEMRSAIAEAHRVLISGGMAFVVLRSTDDYRYGKGSELEPRTFRMGIAETNELGTVQHFLRGSDVQDYFSAFARVEFEKTETTFGGRTRINSDWLITAIKG